MNSNNQVPMKSLTSMITDMQGTTLIILVMEAITSKKNTCSRK